VCSLFVSSFMTGLQLESWTGARLQAMNTMRKVVIAAITP
jgi:hypothetical protein